MTCNSQSPVFLLGCTDPKIADNWTDSQAKASTAQCKSGIPPSSREKRPQRRAFAQGVEAKLLCQVVTAVQCPMPQSLTVRQGSAIEFSSLFSRNR
jgi:hypothetical protein